MTTAQKIINHLHTKSNGVINLSTRDATELIEMVVSQYGNHYKAVAKLYRYNNVVCVWELIRTVQTTDEYIKEQIIKALETAPPDRFLMWECYNQVGEFEGKIYTLNPSLF